MFSLKDGIWIALTPLTLITALFISWQVLASQSFLFPLWYEVDDIGTFIDKYGPQNRYKKQFRHTSKEERLRLFAEISNEINGDGSGLADIKYSTNSKKDFDTLLRDSEVEHLVYVSKIVAVFRYVALLSMLLIVGALYLIKRKMLAKPDFSYVAYFYGVVLFLSALSIYFVGAREIFTFLHEMVFPAGHQWFFYYQDSLMTTLMKAPFIFAYIAGAWVSLTLVVVGFMYFAFSKFLYAKS